MLILVIGMLAILGWVRVNYPRRIAEVFESATQERILKQTMREEFLLSHRASIVYLVVYMLVTGLFAFLLSKAQGLGLDEWHSSVYVSLLFGIVGVVLLLRSAIIRLTQWILEVDFGLNQFHFHSFLTFMLVGVGVLPFVILSLFLEPSMAKILCFGIGTVYVLAYIYRLFWGLKEARFQGVPWHYLILYLCTLEILPLLAAYKIVTSQVV